MVTNRVERGLVTAVRALLILVEAPRGMATSAEVAEAVGSHPVVIRRLFGRLRMAGLVEGRSGPSGGWAIARDPATTPISNIFRALADEPAHGDSALEALLAEANDAYAERLAQITLAELGERQPLPRHS